MAHIISKLWDFILRIWRDGSRKIFKHKPSHSMNTVQLQIALNPLLFDIDSTAVDADGIAASLVRFLSIGPDYESRYELLRKRKTKLDPIARRVIVVPSDLRISEKLVSPLRQAYVAFLVQNFLGTLSLCGMIGEMLAIFKFEISDFKINQNTMTDDIQKKLFGNTFEKLGQERRIDILKVYGLINDEAAAEFEKIRKIRNNYLHYWTKDHGQLENDALQVFVATIDAVLRIFPQIFVEGAMHVDPRIIKYLHRGTT